MEIIVDKGCGVDVHKGTVVACIMGTGIKKEIRTYTSWLIHIHKWDKHKDNPKKNNKRETNFQGKLSIP